MSIYLIKNRSNSLFWNNEFGWTNVEYAEIYTWFDIESLNLPLDGMWVEFKQV